PRAGPSPGPRAAADKYPARSRRGCGDRAALSAARGACRGRHQRDRSGHGAGEPRPRQSLRGSDRARQRSLPRGRCHHGAVAAQDRAHAARNGGSLQAQAPRAEYAWLGPSAPTDPHQPFAPDRHRVALSAGVMARVVHVIGAGLSGLSAAVRLAQAGSRVILHEATAQAGGRARSYYDHTIGMTIDNGNHLVLSGNHAAMSYLRLIGAEHALIGPPKTEFAFVDLKSGERWRLRPN